MTTAQLAKVITFGNQAVYVAKKGDFKAADDWLAQARKVCNANNTPKDSTWEKANDVYFNKEAEVYWHKRNSN